MREENQGSPVRYIPVAFLLPVARLCLCTIPNNLPNASSFYNAYLQNLTIDEFISKRVYRPSQEPGYGRIWQGRRWYNSSTRLFCDLLISLGQNGGRYCTYGDFHQILLIKLYFVVSVEVWKAKEIWKETMTNRKRKQMKLAHPPCWKRGTLCHFWGEKTLFLFITIKSIFIRNCLVCILSLLEYFPTVYRAIDYLNANSVMRFQHNSSFWRFNEGICTWVLIHCGKEAWITV